MTREYLDYLGTLLGAELTDLRWHADHGNKGGLENHTAYLRGMAQMLYWSFNRVPLAADRTPEQVDAHEMCQLINDAIFTAWEVYKRASVRQ